MKRFSIVLIGVGACALFPDLGSLSDGGALPSGDASSTLGDATATPPISPAAPADVTDGPSAARMLVWAGYQALGEDWATWNGRGWGGAIVSIGYLAGLGGTMQYDAHDPPSDGAAYDWMRYLDGLKHTFDGLGMWLYASFHFAPPSTNYAKACPFGIDWFDDAGWAKVTSAASGLAAYVKSRSGSFKGIAFDEELYYGASWSPAYAGNAHSIADTQAKAKQRGVEMMQAIVSLGAGIEILDYALYPPGSWDDEVQQVVNHAAPKSFMYSLQGDFWDGLTSVPGYGQVSWLGAEYYKGANLPGSTATDAPFQYGINGAIAWASQRMSGWDYLSERLNYVPFSWTDSDLGEESAWTSDRGEPFCKNQQAAHAKWGMHGIRADYCYANTPGKYVNGSDNWYVYSASNPPGGHVAGFQAAAQPTNTTSEVPAFSSVTQMRVGNDVVLAGRVDHGMGLRSVRYDDNAGTTGACPHAFVIDSGAPATGYTFHFTFSQTVHAALGSYVTLTAESIKGTRHSIVVKITV